MASGTSGYQRSKSTSSVIPHPHVGDGVTTDRPTAYQHFTWSSRWTCDHPESARCRREEPPTVIGQGAEEHRTWPPMPGAEPPPSRVYRARQRETRGGKAKRREPETQSWQGFPHVCHGHVRPLDRFPKPGALVRFQPRAPAETLTYQRFRTLRRSQSARPHPPHGASIARGLDRRGLSAVAQRAGLTHHGPLPGVKSSRGDRLSNARGPCRRERSEPREADPPISHPTLPKEHPRLLVTAHADRGVVAVIG